jgi:hypothetical protein
MTGFTYKNVVNICKNVMKEHGILDYPLYKSIEMPR